MRIAELGVSTETPEGNNLFSSKGISYFLRFAKDGTSVFGSEQIVKGFLLFRLKVENILVKSIAIEQSIGKVKPFYPYIGMLIGVI